MPWFDAIYEKIVRLHLMNIKEAYVTHTHTNSTELGVKKTIPSDVVKISIST